MATLGLNSLAHIVRHGNNVSLSSIRNLLLLQTYQRIRCVRGVCAVETWAQRATWNVLSMCTEGVCGEQGAMS